MGEEIFGTAAETVAFLSTGTTREFGGRGAVAFSLFQAQCCTLTVSALTHGGLSKQPSPVTCLRSTLHTFWEWPHPCQTRMKGAGTAFPQDTLLQCLGSQSSQPRGVSPLNSHTRKTKYKYGQFKVWVVEGAVPRQEEWVQGAAHSCHLREGPPSVTFSCPALFLLSTAQRAGWVEPSSRVHRTDLPPWGTSLGGGPPEACPPRLHSATERTFTKMNLFMFLGKGVRLHNQP